MASAPDFDLLSGIASVIGVMMTSSMPPENAKITVASIIAGYTRPLFLINGSVGRIANSASPAADSDTDVIAVLR